MVKDRSTHKQDKFLDVFLDMRETPDARDKAFMARQLVVCTLPHSDPGNVEEWTRTNGTATLSITGYYDRTKGKRLYPYGSIPRLLLFWITTQATQKKSRHIELGASLDEFMREVGLSAGTGGGKRSDRVRLREQMIRLFRATITLEHETSNGRQGLAWKTLPVSDSAQMWWQKSSDHPCLWDSWVELGQGFYEAITASVVPLDMRALKALKRSPLALDLYALITYETYRANLNRRARAIPWEGLHAQMGGEYADLWNFRKKVKAALLKIRLVYPGADVQVSGDGIEVRPGRTAISTR